MSGFYYCLKCDKLCECKNEDIYERCYMTRCCDECLSNKYMNELLNMKSCLMHQQDLIIRDMLVNSTTPARHIHKANQEATGMTKERELAFWKDIREQVKYREYDHGNIVYFHREFRDNLDSLIRSIDTHYTEESDD